MRCLDHQHHLWSFRNANSWVPLQTYWMENAGKSRDSCLCLNKPSRWFQGKLKFKYCCSGELSLIPSEANQQPKLWISFPLIFSGTIHSLLSLLCLIYSAFLFQSFSLTWNVFKSLLSKWSWYQGCFTFVILSPKHSMTLSSKTYILGFFSSTFLASFSLSPFLTHLFFSAIKCWVLPFLSYTGHFLSKFLNFHCFEYHP